MSESGLRAGSGTRCSVRCNRVEPRTKSCERLAATTAEKIMSRTNFAEGWNEERVRELLEHDEAQSDEEAVAEDEAAFESTTHTTMEVPVDLVPKVRELIAKRHPH